MPIYEFYCPNNNKIYSFYARSLSQAEKIPRCPENPQFKMERMFSLFSVTGRASEKTEESAATEEDPRMMAAMSAMEREFAGMDTENPDPRQIGHMMRRMTELTGEKMPAPMEEMIRRMEAGEDPEKLEEEFGDALNDAEPEPGEGENIGTKFLRRRRRAERDPNLYEMGDYV